MINTRADETTITALHSDKCEQRDIDEITTLIKKIKNTSTLFIFSLRQAIMDRFKSFGELLIHDGLIRFVVVDGVHLFTLLDWNFHHLSLTLFKKWEEQVGELVTTLWISVTISTFPSTTFFTYLNE